MSKLYNIYQKHHSTISFISKAQNIHKTKYDYSLVEYVTAKHKIKIICAIHGIFNQTPNAHLNGQGCPYCGGSKKSNTTNFIRRANDVHNENMIIH